MRCHWWEIEPRGKWERPFKVYPRSNAVALSALAGFRLI
jgi:hypothetical protein